MQIYADNAATSFPKPLAVSREMAAYIRQCGGSAGRGSYEKAITAQELLITTRKALALLFNAPQPKNIIFTSGATMSLNMLIGGLAKNGVHFVTTSMEHNSVLRPLEHAKALGADYTVVKADSEGNVCTDDIERAIQKNTIALITTHVSNVCGTILPIDEFSVVCKKKNVFFIVDSAQSAGLLPIGLNIADGVAFSGHKALYGPSGVGGFAVTDALASLLSPVVFGGTGSFSHSPLMPSYLPDKFEAGTLNMPGICGLLQGVSFVNSKGIDRIYAKEISLAKILLQGFSKLENIKILGKKDVNSRTGVVAIDFINKDNGEIAFLLSEKYGIDTRCGLHCAPLAHKALGSFDTGCVRFSLGYYNTKTQAEYILECVEKLA